MSDVVVVARFAERIPAALLLASRTNRRSAVSAFRNGTVAAGRTYVAVTRYIRFGRMDSRGLHGHQLTANAFCLCLATHCGRVGECHLPHAVMSAGGHLRLPRLPTEEGLPHATLQLLFPASTRQALFVSELRKRPSCVHLSRQGKRDDTISLWAAIPLALHAEFAPKVT